MVLLVERLGLSLKLFSKLENHYHHHHHHQSNAYSASLQAYKSDVSNCLNQLSLNTIPSSDLLSLIHFPRWFELISMINRAFAKLVMEIDHPMSCWEATVTEDYLSYSLELLDLLNSIASSVSHLSQTRLSLSHGLSLVEKSPSAAMEHLKPIQIQMNEENSSHESDTRKLVIEGKLDASKEGIIREALMVMRSTGFWACGIVLAGLSGDAKKFIQSEFVDSALKGLDSNACKMMMVETGFSLKEVIEVNDGVGRVVAAMAAGENENDEEDEEATEELEAKLAVLENLLEGVDKDTNHLFSQVLAARNELLDNLRHHKAKESIP